MSIYRRIYEQHNGTIPDGYHIHHICDGYHIHHIDGNHSNNHLDNLQCVSPKEHYDIHYAQGDYTACWLMVRTGHLDLSREERSELTKKQMQSPEMKKIVSETMKKKNEVLWANNEFREMQSRICTERFTELWSDPEYKERVSNKISASWDEDRKQKQAKEMSLKVKEYNNKEMTCPHCGKVGKGIGIMNRWHFDKCNKKGI